MPNCFDLQNFGYEQERGPLQIFGSANGLCNYIALEKKNDSSDLCVFAILSYKVCMLLTKGEGGHGHPRNPTLATSLHLYTWVKKENGEWFFLVLLRKQHNVCNHVQNTDININTVTP